MADRIGFYQIKSALDPLGENNPRVLGRQSNLVTFMVVDGLPNSRYPLTIPETL